MNFAPFSTTKRQRSKPHALLNKDYLQIVENPTGVRAE
jgi:hypothetical protein